MTDEIIKSGVLKSGIMVEGVEVTSEHIGMKLVIVTTDLARYLPVGFSGKIAGVDASAICIENIEGSGSYSIVDISEVEGGSYEFTWENRSIVGGKLFIEALNKMQTPEAKDAVDALFEDDISISPEEVREKLAKELVECSNTLKEAKAQYEAAYEKAVDEGLRIDGNEGDLLISYIKYYN